METYKIKGTDEYVEIETEDSPLNPREDFSNLGIMAFYHKRYNLGDENINKPKGEDFNNWDEIEEELKKNYGALNIIKIKLYDHSGISISASNNYPYNFRWDSMMVGFIYTTKEKIKEMGVNKKDIHKQLLGEIETYNQYLTGDIYRYCKYKYIKCDKCNHSEREVLDSCAGFFGYNIKENGILDSIGCKYEDLELIKDSNKN